MCVPCAQVAPSRDSRTLPGHGRPTATCMRLWGRYSLISRTFGDRCFVVNWMGGLFGESPQWLVHTEYTVLPMNSDEGKTGLIWVHEVSVSSRRRMVQSNVNGGNDHVPLAS